MCISPAKVSGAGLDGFGSGSGRMGNIGDNLSAGGVRGVGKEGSDDMEWVGDGVDGGDENIALAGAKWTRLIMAVGRTRRTLQVQR
jgi:hypothetical protein